MGRNLTSQRVRLDRLSAESVSALFVDLDVNNPGDVGGSFAVSDLQGLRLVRSTMRGGPFEVFRLERHIRRSETQAFFACVPMRGSVILHQQGRNCTLARGDIGLIDSRAEYSLGMPDGLDALWVRIVPETLESRVTTTSQIVARRLDGSSGLGLIASRFIMATASQAERLAEQRAAPLASILLDLLTAAALSGEGAPPPRPRSGARTLERAKAFIDHHLGDENLCPALIAAGTGISARYLGQLFAVEGATTMGWTQLRRLELAHQAISNTSWVPGCVADVVYRHGFRNISSFNRAFRRTYGTTPRALMASS